MEDTLLANDLWLGMLGSVGLMAAGYVVRKYLIPFLSVGKRRKYAEYIGGIADELTDELRARYPEKEWLTHLDEATDQLIRICGVSAEISRRAVLAASARK